MGILRKPLRVMGHLEAGYKSPYHNARGVHVRIKGFPAPKITLCLLRTLLLYREPRRLGEVNIKGGCTGSTQRYTPR